MSTLQYVRGAYHSCVSGSNADLLAEYEGTDPNAWKMAAGKVTLDGNHAHIEWRQTGPEEGTGGLTLIMTPEGWKVAED